MKIALLLTFYNCRSELERLIQSLLPNFFDVLIAIDGIYKYTAEQNKDLLLPELSDDGSRELLLTQKNIPQVCVYDMPKSLEFHKRNKYLELCDSFDVDCGIIIDSDEFIIVPEATAPETAFARFKQNIEKAVRETQYNHNVFGIRTLNMNEIPPYESYHPRIFWNPKEMRYLNGSHYYYANYIKEKKDIELFNSQRYNYVQFSHSVIKGVILGHSHNLRSKQTMKMRSEYIPYLIRFEGLVQSHRYDLEQAHKLAAAGKSYEDILREQKIVT